MTTPITTTADRLMELAIGAPAGPYLLDASDGPFASEALVRAPSWGVVARTGLDASLPHWDLPQRAVAALFAACDPQTITALCSTIKEMAAENEKLRAERDHWKANHADIVKRARILHDRTDCPLERVQAFEEVGKAFAERDALRQALSNIETSATYSPHREAGTWDENLAKLIHHHARLLPASAAGKLLENGNG